MISTGLSLGDGPPTPALFSRGDSIGSPKKKQRRSRAGFRPVSNPCCRPPWRSLCWPLPPETRAQHDNDRNRWQAKRVGERPRRDPRTKVSFTRRDRSIYRIQIVGSTQTAPFAKGRRRSQSQRQSFAHLEARRKTNCHEAHSAWSRKQTEGDFRRGLTTDERGFVKQEPGQGRAHARVFKPALRISAFRQGS